MNFTCSQYRPIHKIRGDFKHFITSWFYFILIWRALSSTCIPKPIKFLIGCQQFCNRTILVIYWYNVIPSLINLDLPRSLAITGSGLDILVSCLLFSIASVIPRILPNSEETWKWFLRWRSVDRHSSLLPVAGYPWLLIQHFHSHSPYPESSRLRNFHLMRVKMVFGFGHLK
jgi:hypothetical protein